MLDPAATDAAEMAPSKKKRSPRKKFEIPDGWIARGFVFEVAWPGDLELAGRASGSSPTGGPSPCRWWDHFARRRTPGAWSPWSRRTRLASSPPPIPGSHGHRAAKAKLARLDRRAIHLRRESHHQLTTMVADTYSEVVIEDLDLAAMRMSMGRRAFRRSVSDAALGQLLRSSARSRVPLPGCRGE